MRQHRPRASRADHRRARRRKHDSLVESWLCALIVVRGLFDVVLELLDVVDVDLDVAGCNVEVE